MSSKSRRLPANVIGDSEQAEPSGTSKRRRLGSEKEPSDQSPKRKRLPLSPLPGSSTIYETKSAVVETESAVVKTESAMVKTKSAVVETESSVVRCVLSVHSLACF